VKLTSFEKLEQALSNDEEHKDTRIVRFINVESLDLWCKVKNLLVSRCEHCVQMSDYCSNEDLTPNTNRVLRELRQMSASTLLVPLSEHLRINKNSDILGQLANIQFKNISESYSRLYVLMYRMSSALNELAKLDMRFEDRVYFLQTGVTDDNYSLIILPRDLQIDLKGNNIDGYKRYLAYWESNPNMPIILHTNNASYYSQYAFADNVKVIDSAYEILRHLRIINEDVDRSWGDDWCWLRLLSQASSGKSLLDAFSTHLHVKEFDPKELLSQWDNEDDFGKWLTWLWLKLEGRTPYLHRVFERFPNYHHLLTSVVNVLFDIDPKDKEYETLYRERRDYLLAMKTSGLPSNFWEKYSTTDENEKLFRLTDCTEREREEIIRLFPRVSEDEKKRNFLKLAYSGLNSYLEDYPFDEKRITDYFSKYKRQKLSNAFTDEFTDEVKEIAALRGIWWSLGIQSRNQIVENYYTSNSKIIWIDALGVEFLGLIRAILNADHPGCQHTINLGHCAIPTITELNKDFVSNRQFDYIRDLDELVHKGQFPGYISQQIEVVSRQIRAAVSNLDSFDRVIITSDHGATRGAVVAKGASLKTIEGSTVERNGRFCVDHTHKYEDTFTGCIDINEYHVLGNYDRFSVPGAAKNENHGGASLEEVLVPIVVLSRAPLEEKMAIELLTPEPRMRSGRVSIRFKINKPFDKLSAFVGSKIYDCSKQEDCWCFEAECDQGLEYNVRVVGKSSVGTFRFKVNKGRTDNKDFDL
jgi:hypothetical protein